MISASESDITGENIHVLTNRQEIAATLSRLVENRTTTPERRNGPIHQDSSIKAEDSLKINRQNNLYSFRDLPQICSFRGHTRAFLKVQDGCDGYCTYCIVPRTRPLVHSKPLDVVLQEAQSLVDAGHKEIVITGIFLGAYGQQTVRRKSWPDRQNGKLTDLLENIAKIPVLARVRLSSLEPGDVTGELLDVFCKYPNIMPHLHLSLQSGSDNVLKKMARQYRVGDFRAKVEMIKTQLDRPAITTDIIVGFPGETEGDFEKTVSLAEEVGFAKMHIFAFSPRNGTAAATMQDTVAKRITQERSRILRELDKNLQRQFRQQFINATAEVLLESGADDPAGRSERYFMVCVRDGHKTLKKNDLVRVVLVDNTADRMVGELK